MDPVIKKNLFCQVFLVESSGFIRLILNLNSKLAFFYYLMLKFFLVSIGFYCLERFNLLIIISFSSLSLKLDWNLS